MTYFGWLAHPKTKSITIKTSVILTRWWQVQNHPNQSIEPASTTQKCIHRRNRASAVVVVLRASFWHFSYMAVWPMTGCCWYLCGSVSIWPSRCPEQKVFAVWFRRHLLPKMTSTMMLYAILSSYVTQYLVLLSCVPRRHSGFCPL